MSGKSVSDEFETEVLRYTERSPHSVKFKSQVADLKREGGALVKAVQRKANPAMKSAVRSVQTKSKSAIRDIKSILPSDVIRGGMFPSVCLQYWSAVCLPFQV